MTQDRIVDYTLYNRQRERDSPEERNAWTPRLGLFIQYEIVSIDTISCVYGRIECSFIQIRT